MTATPAFVLVCVAGFWLGIQFLLFRYLTHTIVAKGGDGDMGLAAADLVAAGAAQQAALRAVRVMTTSIPDAINATVLEPLPTVVPPIIDNPKHSVNEQFQLQWSFLNDEKALPYVGSPAWLSIFPQESQKHFNSLAVFPMSNNDRMHGILGVYRNGTRAWRSAPQPPPIDKYPGGSAAGLKNGGFYLPLSDALPLDRIPPDDREAICKQQRYDVSELSDVSVIITFYNEALSTLLRSVHSTLNLTPPPLLREIILVDDHSNNTDNIPGSFLYTYITLLPKVKLMRLPERRGLVWARLAGAKIAKAPVLVVLDSHIEVNRGWLEPQLQRLKEEPRSIVFPRIPSLSSEDLSYVHTAGIGCFLSFKLTMQEKSTLTSDVDKPDPIPSASMAGGIFAVNRNWFWELGGYDEEFCMWGAENVEMGFRAWMCGGRLECTPCSRVFHIYRHGGHAYSSPPQCLWKNRLRTARLWTDDMYPLIKEVVHPSKHFDIGPLDAMLELKERLQCKSFAWFLKNVDPNFKMRVADVGVLGPIRNVKYDKQCLDSLTHSKDGETYGVFWCHGEGGTQAFMTFRGVDQIRLIDDGCLGHDLLIHDCHHHAKQTDSFHLPFDRTIRWKAGTSKEACLGLFDTELKFAKCDLSDERLLWKYTKWKPAGVFELPTYSPSYLAARQKLGDATPIGQKLADATPIGQKLGDANPIRQKLGDANPIRQKLGDANPITIPQKLDTFTINK